jgi:signal transduction histidine kinase
MTPVRAERIRRKLETLTPSDDVERAVLARGAAAFAREGDHFRGVIPFTATTVCQKCHAVPVGYTLGAATVRVSFAQIAQAAEDNWKRSFLIFLIFAGGVIAAAGIMFSRLVARPVDRLVDAAQEIGRGELDRPVPGTGGGAHDELGLLAERFDVMRRSLKEKIDQLDLANRTLSDRNHEVEEALDRLRRTQEDLVRSERLAVTGKMTAQLSHEINNPIHNIHSLLQSSLRKLEGNEPTRGLLAVALEEVGRLAKLTRQMLDVYRGSVVESAWEEVDLGTLLNDIGRTYEETLAGQGVRLTVHADPPLPRLRGARDKLMQVFANLVSNARDAMPRGGTLRIHATAQGAAVVITVADTGSGIPPEHLGRIFDAFFTTKQQVSGVGLGLAVTHGILQHHRGTIAVESTVGSGTTFTLTLPAVIDDGHGTHSRY